MHWVVSAMKIRLEQMYGLSVMGTSYTNTELTFSKTTFS